MKQKAMQVLLLSFAIILGSSYWVFLGVANAATGKGHLLGHSSVDNGEIRWGGSTKYQSQVDFGIAEWNKMKKVKIAPDTATTIEDLKFSDAYSSESIWARYTNKVGHDTIVFNDRFMSEGEAFKKRSTAAHEIGHALGIDDHSSSYSDALMVGAGFSTDVPQAHDKEDYNDKW
ncbi:matrixin family metalloprotease [Cytobacillus praedii]|uniref:matrixin family metalloprotease n=1 Tax=Cytobacillus praedii TaxID=1742358 RepID=UPI002E23E560|nr:matrixin family metalloprotease [Cytobacillus praedii]MED3553877.1 matrixin family metalloprotease [Cytobacillus praedii]